MPHIYIGSHLTQDIYRLVQFRHPEGLVYNYGLAVYCFGQLLVSAISDYRDNLKMNLARYVFILASKIYVSTGRH